jgi:N-acetylglucosaminyl-diphospho-decaprenol L-rhamnosyltransferase
MHTGQPEQPIASKRADADQRMCVSVVIVTYRNTTVISRCLEALAKACPGVGMDVTIVDNASGDGTADAARLAAQSAALHARIIERTINGGFADGCQIGAAAAQGPWLLFLNPDTVIAPGAIDALLDCAQSHPLAGIVGGRFVHADGTIDPRSWWGRPTPWSELCFALGLSSLLPGSPLFDPESPRPWTADPGQEQLAPVVSGALMLVRRELWDELHGFDPSFFMYAEDADFCLRAAKLGYRPMVTARAVCLHEGGKSSSSTRKLMLLFTGKATLVRRHFPRGLRAAGIGLMLTGVFVRAAASKVTGTASPARQQRPTARGADWRALWSAHAEWRGGWARTTPPA